MAIDTKMLKIKNLRGECQHCGGPIEFHAEHVGSMAECPHCSQQTELLLATPPEEGSPVRTKAIVFSVIAVIIMLGGLLGAVIALKRAQRLKTERLEISTKAEEQKPPPPVDSFVQSGFRTSAVTFERATNNSLVYAVGSVGNLADKPRSGVKLELELLNEAGSKIGEAKDYRAVLEPKAEWKFRALVVEKRAVSAKIVGIKEDK